MLVLLLAVYGLLATQYFRVTPYREPGMLLHQRDPATGQPRRIGDVGAPDERQHVNYMKHLLAGKGFPVLVPGSADLYETYQSHQPPLYYLIATAELRALGGDPDKMRGAAELRALSTIFGALTLIGSYFVAKWGFTRPEVGLAAVAFVGFLPMFLALHSAAGNDPLLYALCTWVLAVIGLSMASGWTLGRAFAIGVLVGLALLTKTTAIALLPTLVIALWLSRKSSKPLHWFASLATPILIALPWWIRNQSLYGDPLAMKAFNSAFAGSPKASLFMHGFGFADYWVNWVGWWTLRSFFGVFGYMDIFLDDKVYRIFAALFFLLLLGWFLSLSRSSQARNPRFEIVLWAFVGIVALLFIQFNTTYFQAQARYLFPAIGALGIFSGFGACFFAGNLRRWAWLPLAAALLAANLYVIGKLPEEFYRRALPTVQIGEFD